MDNALKKSFIVLGTLMLWVFLSLLPRESIVIVPKVNYHDSGYENTWIRSIDKNKGVIRVQTAESKIVITFQSEKRVLSRYNLNWIAPVTILCPDSSNYCDFDSLRKLYVNNEEVKLLKREFLGEARRLKLQLIKKPS